MSKTTKNKNSSPKRKKTPERITGSKIKATRKSASKVSDDNPEWTEKDFKKARPASKVLPEIFGKKIAGEMLKKRGRPKKAHPKISTTIRLDADILRSFQADGEGWQSRINEALREWVDGH